MKQSLGRIEDTSVDLKKLLYNITLLAMRQEDNDPSYDTKFALNIARQLKDSN